MKPHDDCCYYLTAEFQRRRRMAAAEYQRAGRLLAKMEEILQRKDMLAAPDHEEGDA